MVYGKKQLHRQPNPDALVVRRVVDGCVYTLGLVLKRAKGQHSAPRASLAWWLRAFLVSLRFFSMTAHPFGCAVVLPCEMNELLFYGNTNCQVLEPHVLRVTTIFGIFFRCCCSAPRRKFTNTFLDHPLLVTNANLCEDVDRQDHCPRSGVK